MTIQREYKAAVVMVWFSAMLFTAISSAEPAVSRRLQRYGSRDVARSDAVVIGAVASIQAGPDLWSRRSRIQVETVLFGHPAGESIEFDWRKGGRPMIGPVGRPDKSSVGRRALWFVTREGDADWDLVLHPLYFDALFADQLEWMIASLESAPRDEWKKHLSFQEVREYEQPLLAVRNYLVGLRETVPNRPVMSPWPAPKRDFGEVERSTLADSARAALIIATSLGVDCPLQGPTGDVRWLGGINGTLVDPQGKVLDFYLIENSRDRNHGLPILVLPDGRRIQVVPSSRLEAAVLRALVLYKPGHRLIDILVGRSIPGG